MVEVEELEDLEKVNILHQMLHSKSISSKFNVQLNNPGATFPISVVRRWTNILLARAGELPTFSFYTITSRWRIKVEVVSSPTYRSGAPEVQVVEGVVDGHSQVGQRIRKYTSKQSTSR